MKDLDFDELDRAVSSLMTSTTKGKPEHTEDTVLTIAPTLSTNNAPAFPAQQSEISSPAATSTPSAPSTPSPAARRSGRFMDVVHPSSDMKSAAAARRVSREGVSIAAPDGVAPVDPVSTPEPATTSYDAEPDTTSVLPETETATASWPDPIDFHSTTPTDNAPAVTEEPEPAVVEPRETEQAPIANDTDMSEPLQSPFLSDAKVEKRPLGAFAITEPTAATESAVAPVEDTPVAEDTSVAQETTAEADPEPPVALPEELKSDIVAIEADTAAADSPEQPVANTADIPMSAPVVTPAPTVGPTSIKQQYKEEPSSTPADHAPIYDSASYTQPLAHPAKKKSGWLVVLFIVLLILIGAGAGAAIYYFVLSV